MKEICLKFLKFLCGGSKVNTLLVCSRCEHLPMNPVWKPTSLCIDPKSGTPPMYKS